MDNYDLYDQINTTAANWLRLYAKNINKSLGIKNFNCKNKFHLWTLKMIELASIANGYDDYYVDCNWFVWFKFKFLKHFKHLKKVLKKNNNIAYIDVKTFVDEVCIACKVKSVNIECMFDGYWG